MSRIRKLGAAAVSVPTTRSPAAATNGARRAFSLGLLALCARPLLAAAAPADDARYDAACTSAKAVHDTRCPNYTGFKTPFEPGTSTARRPARHRAKIRVGRTLDRGIASWYGPGFQGRLTANGERFDMNELTAAHKTLPFGTRVQVESHRTGRKVLVRINDRGPFVGGRIIDLSKAAAQQLGIVDQGHALVVLREASVSTA